MLEMILNPRRSERKPWELFFIGLLYAGISVLMVHWFFGGDIVLVKYSGLLVVTFTVMLSMPYLYYTIKLEEEKDSEYEEGFKLLKEHGRTIYSLLFLFLGFLVAFSVLYIALGSTDNYQVQIETYCSINSPNNYEFCVQQYGVMTGKITGEFMRGEMLGGVFSNNLRVLIFTIIFSIIFGAGGIFILAWNASVISAAMVIYANNDLYSLPISLARYMIHGFPEIAAYFIGTLAGGIIGFSIIRKEFRSEKIWKIMYDVLLLIISAIVILLIAGFIEVYITPIIFR
ncbi:MAG: stage II sporulation protein M [Nanoarchaeota archaeon]|nr:stage II sporulation protein M [Nanoarchaeota archaeon]